ncbi:MAG: hypothetical protein AB7Y46_14460 [Armatimonadota bacterium]
MAAVEAARERVAPRVGRVAFVGGFVLLTVLVPVTQLTFELARGGPIQALDVLRQPPTAEGLAQFERALEEQSVVARAVRERWHWLSLVALRAGNQKAVVGREGAIFYRPSLDAATAAGFMRDPAAAGHPLPAIVAFRDCLRRQGVELVLLIAPGKESIYPDWLSRRYPTQAGPPANEDMAEFLAELRRQGITAVYPAEALWRGRLGGLMYLRQDTHWTPEGMALAADELVRRLPDLGPPVCRLAVRPMRVTHHGDLYQMLALHPSLPEPMPPETVTVQQVVDAGSGRLVEPDPASAVVLLGDSFTNIYSVAAMGWGDHAGLAEHLALRLGRPVDVIALNDGGVNTARINLARRPDPLAGKRVVIWQFAARDLVVSNGQWQLIEIGASREDDGDAAQ